MYNFKSTIMKRTIILTTAILIATITFSQVAINKDGSEPDANTILHVKGSGTHALYVDYANGYVGLNTNNPQYRLHVNSTVTDTRTYGTVFKITGGSTSSETYAGVYSYIDGTGGITGHLKAYHMG